MKALILTFCLVTCAAFGSGETGVVMDRLTISSSKHKLEVTATEEPKGGTAIAVTFEGKKFAIPADVMALFPDVHLSSVRILTHVPGGNLPEDWLKNHPYIISFDYGDVKIHGRDGHAVEVYSRGRLHFDKASYSGWEKFIPEGKFKNRWKIYQPMILVGDSFNGTADGIECPLDK